MLEKYGATLIGANVAAIKKAEDRQLLQRCHAAIGLDVPNLRWSTTPKAGLELAGKMDSR